MVQAGLACGLVGASESDQDRPRDFAYLLLPSARSDSRSGANSRQVKQDRVCFLECQDMAWVCDTRDTSRYTNVL